MTAKPTPEETAQEIVDKIVWADAPDLFTCSCRCHDRSDEDKKFLTEYLAAALRAERERVTKEYDEADWNSARHSWCRHEREKLLEALRAERQHGREGGARMVGGLLDQRGEGEGE